ncbi:hypothetical protein SEVIR_4G277203v4 [Setaria viridis]
MRSRRRRLPSPHFSPRRRPTSSRRTSSSVVSIATRDDTDRQPRLLQSNQRQSTGPTSWGQLRCLDSEGLDDDDCRSGCPCLRVAGCCILEMRNSQFSLFFAAGSRSNFHGNISSNGGGYNPLLPNIRSEMQGEDAASECSDFTNPAEKVVISLQ